MQQLEALTREARAPPFAWPSDPIVPVANGGQWRELADAREMLSSSAPLASSSSSTKFSSECRIALAIGSPTSPSTIAYPVRLTSIAAATSLASSAGVL